MPPCVGMTGTSPQIETTNGADYSVLSFRKMSKKGYIYLMTNVARTVVYIGVTSDIEQRVWQHKHHYFPNSFTAKYNVTILVYFEEWPCLRDAIAREKEIKKWRREKKHWLIEQRNRNWEEIVL
jgi:putative endonuclease